MAIWIEVVAKQIGQDKIKRLKLFGKTGGQENLMQQQLYLDVLVIHCQYLCKSTDMPINDTRFRQVRCKNKT